MNTVKTLKVKKTTMVFFLILIVWADIGMTYIGIEKVKTIDPAGWANQEMSFTVGPLIKNFGIVQGLILGGIINSLLIFFIAIAFPIEFTHGVLTGIFTLALAINFRFFFM